MTRIKFCGFTRLCDIETANALMPEYIGFVFAPKSKRYISPEKAAELKRQLDSHIKTVGVFVNENPHIISNLLNGRTIDLAQLHGGEDEAYISRLRALTDKPLIQAFRIDCRQAITAAGKSSAEYVLLDSGAGTGMLFDWKMIENIEKPYFLAGGLTPENAADAVKMLHPYAVDVSSGIESNGFKNQNKMAAFAAAVRKED